MDEKITIINGTHKIYSVVVFGTTGVWCERYETFYLSPWFMSKEEAEKELERLKSIPRKTLEDKYNADFKGNTYEIEEADLVIPENCELYENFTGRC